ncbi:hypothetical protein IBA8401_50270 [Pseudomonas syringae]
MPMMHITDFRPESGILFDIMQSLAHHVGLEASYHVMPRLRIQSALERGEVDMHCYSAQAWYPDLSGDLSLEPADSLSARLAGRFGGDGCRPLPRAVRQRNRRHRAGLQLPGPGAPFRESQTGP